LIVGDIDDEVFELS